MKLTEQEVQMFDALRKSDLGSQLVGYIERLESSIADSRTWTEKDTIESARQAVSKLTEFKKHLIVTGGKQTNPNQYV